jgi:hypothetical protein
MPLEMNAAFQLLYPNDRNIVALKPGVRLQVMTPIMAQGADPDAPIVEVETTSAKGFSLTIEGRLTDNLLGYEIASYSVHANQHAPGVSISPLSVQRHINGRAEPAPAPVRNYFQAVGATAFYGVFYKAGETEFTALIVGGRDKADLDRRTTLLKNANVSSCETLNNDMCTAIPKRVAINPMVAVTINGSEMLLSWGSTVGGAIRFAGEREPNAVLPRLALSRPYRNRTAAIEFDHTNPAILNLVLMGGELISWK